MKIKPVILALSVVLGLGLTPAAGADLVVVDPGPVAPGGVLETNPVGTLNWLPPVANESPDDSGNHRLTVVYDHSLDDSGEPAELIGKGPFGMKIFTTAVLNPHPATAEPFPLQMIGHSPWVSSVDDLGGPEELDAIFMGVAGDVRDGDCARLDDGDPEDFSAAYTVTRSVFDPAYEPDVCELVDDVITDVDGNITGFVVTTYVPGFWIDVRWPLEMDTVGETSGHHFAEVWYGALVDTDGTDGEWYTEADTPGNSTSIGGPIHVDVALELSATPGGWGHEGCYALGPVPGLPNSVDEVGVDLTELPGSTVQVALWNKVDWDLFVETPSGVEFTGGGGFTVSEQTEKIPYESGNWTIRGCNFAGEPTVLVTLSVD